MTTSVKRKPTGRQFGLGNIDNRLAEIRDAIDPSAGQANIIKIFLMGYLEVIHGALIYERKGGFFNKIINFLQSEQSLFCYQKRSNVIQSIPDTVMVRDPFYNQDLNFEGAFQEAIKKFPRKTKEKLTVAEAVSQETIEDRIQLIKNVEEALYNASIHASASARQQTTSSNIFGGQGSLTQNPQSHASSPGSSHAVNEAASPETAPPSYAVTQGIEMARSQEALHCLHLLSKVEMLLTDQTLGLKTVNNELYNLRHHEHDFTKCHDGLASDIELQQDFEGIFQPFKLKEHSDGSLAVTALLAERYLQLQTLNVRTRILHHFSSKNSLPHA
ncbi:MAG: hypothetical protein Kow00121_54390 [Elainellaceae cyanobacterium]